ncbi:hypothetical protein [Owenweeksia hongkongensis]|uniref:hypothetical protein n=1 Tax=Owenweeksia hongkongensis TaxID=253245 RepID=UPI003A8F5631
MKISSWLVLIIVLTHITAAYGQYEPVDSNYFHVEVKQEGGFLCKEPSDLAWVWGIEKVDSVDGNIIVKGIMYLDAIDYDFANDVLCCGEKGVRIYLGEWANDGYKLNIVDELFVTSSKGKFVITMDVEESEWQYLIFSNGEGKVDVARSISYTLKNLNLAKVDGLKFDCDN